MTKKQFLGALYDYLAPLPEEGRREVVRYYEGCFVRGLANGQSEDEIARGLGDPRMLAADALGIPYNPAEAARQPEVPPVRPIPQPQAQPFPQAVPVPPAYPESPPPSRGGFGRLLAMTVMLLFLNVMIMIPIGAALWSALLSFGAAALGAILTPAAFAVDWLANGEFYPAKLFISFAGTGFGILLAVAFIGLVKFGYRATLGYIRWNVNTWRGRN